MLIRHDIPPNLFSTQEEEEGDCSNDHLPSDLPDLVSDTESDAESYTEEGQPLGFFRIAALLAPKIDSGPMSSFDSL